MKERVGEDVELAADADITLRNVTFTYPNAKQKAIDNVNLTIHPGETIALVGENGSGKSTLVRLISGIYQPDEGEVRYGGINTNCIYSFGVQKHFRGIPKISAVSNDHAREHRNK